MKPKKGTKELGICLGQRLAVTSEVRGSTWQVSPPDVLHWGGSRLTLGGRLPVRLVRLTPRGYLTPKVKAADWEPFVTLAVGMGLL